MAADRKMRVSLLLPVAALLFGCRGVSDSHLLRMISEEPRELLQLDEIGRAQAVFTWRFESNEDLGAWKIAGADETRLDSGTLLIVPQGNNPLMWRRTQLDASTLDAIKLVIINPGRGLPELFWGRTGKNSPFQGKLLGELKGEATGSERSFYFPVAMHPDWSDLITRFRVDPTYFDENVGIREVTGLKYVISRKDFEATQRRPWKVEFEGDRRDALLSAVGMPLDWRLRIPETNPRLHFSYLFIPSAGIFSSATGPPTLPRASVVVSTPGESKTRIFQARLGPGAKSDLLGWSTETIDLTRFAGKEAEIRFKVEPADSNSSVPGFVAWANPEITAGQPALPNIILISIDTLRSDRLSLNGYPRPTTPGIDAWAARSGVNFRRAISPAPWTLPSHTSMFTGLDATRHGVNYDGPAPTELHMLAEILRDAGYSTLASTAGGWVRAELGLGQGFNVYRASDPLGQEELGETLEWARRLLRRSVDRPFFLFFHTYEVHEPYRSRLPYYLRLTQGATEPVGFEIFSHQFPMLEEKEHRLRRAWKRKDWQGMKVLPEDENLLPQVSDLYDSGVAYADAHVEQLLDEVSDLGLDEKTVIVLTSDHGTSLGEEGRKGHGYLTDDNLLVPLIIAYPERLNGGRTVTQPVSIIDILPTILEFAGLPAREEIDGISLVPLLEGRSRSSASRAWSYAPKTNEGLSLRIGDEFKWIIRNSPWLPPEEREELEFLSDETAGIAGGRSGVASLRRQLGRLARRKLAEVPGVRMQFRNPEDRTLEGLLKGRRISIHNVKTPDMPCACISWGGDRGIWGVSFEVPPGVSYEVTLEDAGAEAIEIELAWSNPDTPGEPAIRQTVDPRELPLTLEWDGVSWKRAAAEGGKPGPRAGVTLHRIGEQKATPADPADAALLRELQALGYLE